MTNRPKPKKTAAPSDDLRNLVAGDEFETEFGITDVRSNEVSEGKIFGLAAGERMILSIILFLAVTVLGVAMLFATNTIVLR